MTVLDRRLAACAALVREGAAVCDVGTDHAYLPCFLVQSGKTSRAIAADVNPGPLASAGRHIRESGCSGQIRTVLSDGLRGIGPAEADDIVIAGMGGELIARIVLECGWLRDPDKRLILQPMTRAPFLRTELLRCGFSILEEVPVLERGHGYTVLHCAWTGERCEANPLFALAGRLPESHAPDRDAVLLRLAQQQEKIAAGLSRSQQGAEDAELHRRLAAALRAFLPNPEKYAILKQSNCGAAGPARKKESGMKVKELYQFMNEFAPFDRAEEFDNCGLLVGDPEQEVAKIGLALDITNEIVEKAHAMGVDLIITHHPVIFHPLKRVCAGHPVYGLIRYGISVISAHTNMDKAPQGINAVLAEYYHLQNVASPLCLDDLGRIGELESPMPVPEYAKLVKESLGAQSVRYLDCGVPAQKVAYISGCGAGMFSQVMECDIDTFITGDLKLDLFVEAQNRGINLIEAGHFDSENVIFDSLGKQIEAFCGIRPLLLSDENRIQTV